MTTRIIFNGQEYASTEAMPQAVRTAYKKALSKLEDADQANTPLRRRLGRILLACLVLGLVAMLLDLVARSMR